jgi:hypothetical protein
MRLAANECSVAPEVSTSKMMLGKIFCYSVPAPDGAGFFMNLANP